MTTTPTRTHSCGTHNAYKLSCGDYDAIRSRHAGSCWRCLVRPATQIDHDHAEGMAAVRGAVCGPCNVRMIRVDAGKVPPSFNDRRYLENVWHRDRPIPFIPDGRANVRSFRVDMRLWELGQEIAYQRRETLSQVVRTALVEYVETHGGSVER